MKLAIYVMCSTPFQNKGHCLEHLFSQANHVAVLQYKERNTLVTAHISDFLHAWAIINVLERTNF